MNQNLYSSGAIPRSNPSYPMAGMQGSVYAPPLNYNQPTEVVGGYDARINPMTGQEIPQNNFARGGNVKSEAGLASLLASRGRNGDSMLIHMAPSEVKGLQSLAQSHGGSLTINPDTGLYEASFLKKLLPTLLGFGLNFIFPGLGALGSAALVGAGETIRTGGDLGKGLMAGLGAFGGAGLSAGLSAAAGAAGAAGTTAAGAGLGSTAASALEPVIVTGKTIGSPNLLSLAKGAAANKGTSFGTEFLNLTGRNLSTMGRGIGALGSEAGRSAFVGAIPGGTAGVAAGGMGIANALSPETKMPKNSPIDTSYYQSYGYDPDEGKFLGGEWKKDYPGLEGYAEGGDVKKDEPPPPQAPAGTTANLEDYMSQLNKFVASPVAAPPKKTPPPATTPPPTPGRPNRDDFDGVDFSGIDFGNFMGGGMNGLAGIMGNNYRGNDSRMQWDPDTGSFTRPGTRTSQQPPPATTPPAYNPINYSGRPVRGGDSDMGGYGGGFDMGGSSGDFDMGGNMGSRGGPQTTPMGGGMYGPTTGNQQIEMGDMRDPRDMQDNPYQPPTPFNEPRELTPDPTPYSPRIIEEEAAPSMRPELPPGFGYGSFGNIKPILERADPSASPFELLSQGDPISSYDGRYEKQVQPDRESFLTPFNEPRELAPAPTPYSPRIIEEEAALPMPSARSKFAQEPTEYGLGQFDQNYDQFGNEYNFGFAKGGVAKRKRKQRLVGGKLVTGKGDGMSDSIKANISGKQEARLTDGEFVIPADVVSHLGNGSTNAGSKRLYDMMAKVRKARTGRAQQSPQVDVGRYLPR